MRLEVDGLVGGYDQVPVVRDIHLAVEAGEIVAVLGRNGMGKSTLLGTVFGQVKRFDGGVRVDGVTVAPARPHRLATLGASLMPEDRGVFPSLTIAENLALATRSESPPIDPRDVFPLLRDRSRQRAGTLSGGQKQQVGIARAVLSGTRLIAIDELTQGLQPSLVTETFALLRAMADAGRAVLIVDQNPAAVVGACDRVVIMEGGRIVLDERTGPTTLQQVEDLLVVR